MDDSAHVLSSGLVPLLLLFLPDTIHRFHTDLEPRTVRSAGGAYTSLSAREQVTEGRGQVRHFGRWQSSASFLFFCFINDFVLSPKIANLERFDILRHRRFPTESSTLPPDPGCCKLAKRAIVFRHGRNVQISCNVLQHETIMLHVIFCMMVSSLTFCSRLYPKKEVLFMCAYTHTNN